MNRIKKFDVKLFVSVIIGALVYFSVWLLLTANKIDCLPDTAIGVEGLRQVRRYLGAELITEFASAVSLILAAFIGSAVYKLGRRDKSVDKLFFSPLAVVLAGVAALLILLTEPVKNRWDIQTELNGYKGLRIMKLTSMYIDCGKDLKEQETRELTVSGLMVGSQYHGYTRKSGRGAARRIDITEYTLESDGNTLAQLARNDYIKLKDKLWTGSEHTVRLFAHSGLISELDGIHDDFADDYTSMFTLTYENEYLVRNTRPDEAELMYLYLVIKKDGEMIGQINMAEETDFYLPKMTDLNYGMGVPNYVPVDRSGQIVYLEALIDGESRRVSNTVRLGIGGIIDE